MIKLQYEIAQIVSMLRAHTPHRLAITFRVLNSIRSLNSWHMNKLMWILRGQYNDYSLIALDILSPWFCQQFDMFVHMLCIQLGPSYTCISHTNNWYRNGNGHYFAYECMGSTHKSISPMPFRFIWWPKCIILIFYICFLEFRELNWQVNFWCFKS